MQKDYGSIWLRIEIYNIIPGYKGVDGNKIDWNISSD